MYDSHRRNFPGYVVRRRRRKTGNCQEMRDEGLRLRVVRVAVERGNHFTSFYPHSQVQLLIVIEQVCV